MVGFVLIIVLVAVIVLIFLGFSMRPQPGIKQNKEIENFLYSSMLYTSSCYESPEIIYNIKDLIGACYDNEKCADGKETCVVLEETYKQVIDNSWNIGENSVEKAYILKIYDEVNNTLLDLNEGEETNTRNGADLPLYISGENIHVNMKIFY